MKNLRLVAMVMALTALPIQAQIELSGAMSLSELSGALGGADLLEPASRTGMAFGLGLILPLGGPGLNLGAGWAQKGVVDIVTDPGTLEAVTRLIDLDYIEIPIHVRVPLLSAGLTSLYLVVGPTFGFNIGCKVTEGAAAIEECSQLANGPDFKKTDIGGTAGLGISFGLGGILYAGVDARYTTGMTSINNISADVLKNRTLSLGTHVGISIF